MSIEVLLVREALVPHMEYHYFKIKRVLYITTYLNFIPFLRFIFEIACYGMSKKLTIIVNFEFMDKIQPNIFLRPRLCIHLEGLF